MTSSISNFQNRRKTDLANIAQIICRKFHQNRPIHLSSRASTHTHTHIHIHTHTHTHTYTHTHNLGSIATYSGKLTEYKYGEEINVVEKFTYLGSIVSKDGGADEDIRNKISKVIHASRTINNIWQSSNLSLKNKIRIFITNVN